MPEGKRMLKQQTFIAHDRKVIDEERGIYEAWITTEAIDRDGDIIRAAGGEVENYLRNPVVLFGHNYRNPENVIGKALEVNKVLEGARKGIKLVWQFLERGVSEFADLVHTLWKDEILNAFSVGFIALEWEDLELPEGEENRYAERYGGVAYDITGWELLEASIVTIPANQDALRNALKSMDVKNVLEADLLGALEPLSLEEIAKRVKDAVDITPAQAMRQLANGLGIKASKVKERMEELDGRRFELPSEDDNINDNDTATTEGAQEIDEDEASHSDLEEMPDEVADQIIELLDTLKENFK